MHVRARPARSQALRWRHRRGRGVADIVAIILMLFVVVVLAAILFVIIRGYIGSTSSTPGLATALALSSPAEAVGYTSIIPACSTAPCNFYNVTVQDASHGLEIHDLLMEVIGQNGSLLSPPGGIDVLNATNAVVAQCGFGLPWTSGGAIPVTSSLTFVIYTSGAPPTSLSGGALRVTGINAYSGSIEVLIT